MQKNYSSKRLGMGVVWSHPIVVDTFASEGGSVKIKRCFLCNSNNCTYNR